MRPLTFYDFDTRALPVNTETAQYGILYQAVGMGGECGEALNFVKKIIRDGETAKRREDLLIECGDVLFYMRQLLHTMGMTMNEAAQAELNKLDEMRRSPADELA